ncbi:hypothetical protein [Vibrio vulnificus]|uniref:hypothetical protein n=1 Tax=Vibrio vulnificus TaxID=672 RepID=UPI00188A622F|nr:hypothetical protein [Vibrio vulnificus]MBF4450167.1 hypothetical protein [Vibrio vulnificus]MBF4496753.1 hypothetical protein [Vibrio vulnificus]MBL6178203.1 hypothetical protein [Vibrio vulnificus]HDY7980324.1 hypothetical protein [Vibrio vulnificus]HDY8003785.1 hypothetical protein [Vibrio vulnificus]
MFARMRIIGFEELAKRRLDFEQQLENIEQQLENIERILGISCVIDTPIESNQNTKKQRNFLNKYSHLLCLIRIMVKSNLLLKRNRLFKLDEVFRLYKAMQQICVIDVRLILANKLPVKCNDKARGELLWQQVFA